MFGDSSFRFSSGIEGGVFCRTYLLFLLFLLYTLGDRALFICGSCNGGSSARTRRQKTKLLFYVNPIELSTCLTHFRPGGIAHIKVATIVGLVLEDAAQHHGDTTFADGGILWRETFTAETECYVYTRCSADGMGGYSWLWRDFVFPFFLHGRPHYTKTIVRQGNTNQLPCSIGMFGIGDDFSYPEEASYAQGEGADGGTGAKVGQFVGMEADGFFGVGVVVHCGDVAVPISLDFVWVNVPLLAQLIDDPPHNELGLLHLRQKPSRWILFLAIIRPPSNLLHIVISFRKVRSLMWRLDHTLKEPPSVSVPGLRVDEHGFEEPVGEVLVEDIENEGAGAVFCDVFGVVED